VDSRNGKADPEWESPIPLCEQPVAEPFPVEVFPARIARFATEAARAVGVPLDFVGLPILAIAGGAVGASRALEIKAQWTQRPLLYVGVVGSPGDGKTPALDLVAKPIYKAQQKLKVEYDAAMERYETELAEYNRLKKAARNNNQDVKLPDEPDKPTLDRVMVNDATVESLGPVLSQNSRGVIMIRDELAAWVTSANQYKGGRGSDRQFWLSNWAGVPATIDRAKHQAVPIIIPHPFVSVVGGVQPDLLATLRDEKGRADGFLDRILFAFPDAGPAPEWTWEEIPEETLAPWHQVIEELLRLNQQSGQHGQKPELLRLATEARGSWEEIINSIVRDQNRLHFPAILKGPWAKLKVYAARLALIVHLLRWIARETEEKNVDRESVTRAGELIRYFQSHARKVYAAIGADPEVEDAKRVLEWIERERPTEFKRYEVFEDVKGQRFPLIEDLDRPLDRLAKHRYIRQRETQKPPRGRPPDPVFEVNPLAYRNHPVNPKNPKNGHPNGISSDSLDSSDSPMHKREPGEEG
jgi:hypothetical protein